MWSIITFLKKLWSYNIELFFFSSAVCSFESNLDNSHFVIIRTLKSLKCPKQNYETTALKSKRLLIKSPSSNKMASTKPLQFHDLSWKWKSSLKALLCPLDALCLPLAVISPGIKQNPLVVFSFFEGCRIISKFMGFCF